jgi:hypothetical protein
VKRLEECMLNMSNLVKALWPHAKLHPFGSCISNFAMRNSDVDFCLVMPTWPDGTECDKSEVVERLSEYLEDVGMLNVTALPHARVPIVKLTEVSSPSATWDETVAYRVVRSANLRHLLPSISSSELCFSPPRPASRLGI